MITPFPISSPKPAPRETLPSYFSRVAATWCTEVVDLALDMGTNFKSLIAGDEKALEAARYWARLSTDECDELLSWTGTRAGNVQLSFRGEVYGSRSLRNPSVRGCPCCLREDADGHDGPSLAAYVIRGDWQFREANICIRHSRPLVTLWTETDPRKRFNIGVQMQAIERQILSGELDPAPVQTDSYDKWLDERLRTGQDETWLRSFPLYPATIFCRLLGAVLSTSPLSTQANTEESGSVHEVGFQVARLGEMSIASALDAVAANTCGARDGPSQTFGPLYDFLANPEYGTEFEPFRQLLRGCIRRNWAIGAGEVVLGEETVERQFHSLLTAAREYGVGEAVLRPFLIEAGAIRPDDPRPNARLLFCAKTYHNLLAEIPSFVGVAAMKEATGTTRGELRALKEAGLLLPRTNDPKVKSPWSVPDGLAFVEGLRSIATETPGSEVPWERLLDSALRKKLSLRLFIEAVQDGRLKAGLLPNVSGFHGIVVRSTEVNLVVAEHQRQMPPPPAHADGARSAAEFGRASGLRDDGSFTRLIMQGHTPGLKAVNSRTHRAQYFVRQSDIEAFNARFISLAALCHETGMRHPAILSKLNRAGIGRFAPNGEDYGPLFLRSEVATVFPEFASNPRYGESEDPLMCSSGEVANP